MWARVTELGFGLWLLASPFVFDHSASATSLWLTDVLSGMLLVILCALNYWRPSSRSYLAVPVLGAWLIVSALLSGPHPIAPPHQNHIMVGFTIMMVGIVPNRALGPPEKWIAFEKGEAQGSLGNGSERAHDAGVDALSKESDHQRETKREHPSSPGPV
ncbi:MAG TPA: SPW repeat protein [Vicinamibacteria bacterium]|nr:SPW repeat protein [Vicinamibacteria bacterium]